MSKTTEFDPASYLDSEGWACKCKRLLSRPAIQRFWHQQPGACEPRHEPCSPHFNKAFAASTRCAVSTLAPFMTLSKK